MIKLGLCSVTFRKMIVDEVIRTARENFLDAIEWGADVHVPPALGRDSIRDLAEKCKLNGLSVPSYGSYFDVLAHEPEDFGPVLNAAEFLGSEVIRVWAGWVDPSALTGGQLDRIVRTTRAIADKALKQGVKIAFEFHDNTPTHGGDNALKLFRAIDHPNVFSYWQVLPFEEYEKSLDNLKKVLPLLVLVHIQNPQGADDLGPLADKEKDWMGFVGLLREAGWDGCMFFEFNKDNSPEQLARDVKALQRVLAGT